MYAVGHTSHTLISLSERSENSVRNLRARSKKNHKGVFYRAAIRGETWSFLESYELAKGFQSLLFLDGVQG